MMMVRIHPLFGALVLSTTLTQGYIPPLTSRAHPGARILSDTRLTRLNTATSPQRTELLRDARGHVNQRLAERIWKWESKRRSKEGLPPVDFSVRSGLRLVEELAGKDESLVQEGLWALLEAMQDYDDYLENLNASEVLDFADYARTTIQRHVAKTQQEAQHPLRLPRKIVKTVEKAKQVAHEIKASKGATPTLAQVAQRLGLEADNLELYLQLARARRHTLSVESTVEVVRPDDAVHYQDQDAWELEQGYVLDDGRAVHRDEIVDQYLDPTREQEGNDEAWVRQDDGPMSDYLPDQAQDTADAQSLEAIRDVIRHDLAGFLEDVLTDLDLQVIRLSFGLDGAPALPMRKIAAHLQLDPEQVSWRLTRGLEKLQDAYYLRYLDANDDEEEDDEVLGTEDSV